MHRVHSQLEIESLFARGNSRPLQRVSNPVCTDSAESFGLYEDRWNFSFPEGGRGRSDKKKKPFIL